MHRRSHGLKAHVLCLMMGAACATDEADSESPTVSASAASRASASAGLPAATRSADVSAAPVPISPTLGGSVLSVGQYQAELAVFADGAIEALVFDAQATAVAPELVNGLSAAFSVDGNAKAEARLLWDAETKRFRGQHGLDPKLVGRPIDVTLVIEGKTQSGVLTAYTPLPRAAVSGSAQARADAPSPALLAPKKPSGGAAARAGASTSASGSAKASASATLAVPKPKVVVSTRSTAADEKSGASVKAKVKLGFGN